MMEFLSEQGKKWVKSLPPLAKAHFDNFNNMYSKDNNPNGLVNMGTAESHLVNKEICDLLKKVETRMELTGYHIHYNRFEGSDEFRTAIANHWQKVIFGDTENISITKDNIATCTGCTVALNYLATLIADPGDVFLIPAPYYSSFVEDINERAGVIAVAVPCAANLNREAFEKAFNEQQKKGRRVRAVLFSSPNNPIGIVYDSASIRQIIDFAMEHNLDIISDEIYAQTVFDPKAKFVSTLKLVPEEYRHRVHVTSSFAKDFVLSGFKAGFCISFNPSIIQGFASLSYYSCISSHTQAVLTELLKSCELPELIQLSKNRLREAYCFIREGFHNIGIETMEAQAGIFIMADFSKFMKKMDFEEEYKLCEKLYHDLMINVSPGQLFGTEKPGWFRICYASDKNTIEEACRRLAKLDPHQS